ncbi:MAG: phosphatase PAP2 family protein [Proteobacteria bacterium]|nr:phosphatase PAP2 family protein [Pseudomonadota bacterium]
MHKTRTGTLYLLLAVLATGAANAAAPLSDSREDAGELGDSLQFAVPLAALALTYTLAAPDRPGVGALDFNARRLLHLDGSPRHDLALALGRSVVATETLKFAVNENRPNGGDHSFPSGHTAFAFTGAEFIRKEYGWRWGVPSYAVAGYVGWSRVAAREHYTHDVLAGALIGILSNHDLREMRTRHGLLSVAPVAVQDEGRTGLLLQFTFAY